MSIGFEASAFSAVVVVGLVAGGVAVVEEDAIDGFLVVSVDVKVVYDAVGARVGGSG